MVNIERGKKEISLNLDRNQIFYIPSETKYMITVLFLIHCSQQNQFTFIKDSLIVFMNDFSTKIFSLVQFIYANPVNLGGFVC